MAKNVMESIIKTGKVVRGWLGVSIQDLTPDLASSLGIKETAGALISGVENGSPADKAGLKRGDLVIGLNDKKVEDSTSLRNMVSAAMPGTKIDIVVIRDGKKVVLPVTLGEYNEKKATRISEYDNILKGVSVQDLTPGLREKMDLSDNVNGVLVTGVPPELEKEGLLRPNDIIQEVNRAVIQSVQDYDRAVSRIGAKDAVLLLLYRNGGSVYISIRP
jgi:serine protease Do